MTVPIKRLIIIAKSTTFIFSLTIFVIGVAIAYIMKQTQKKIIKKDPFVKLYELLSLSDSILITIPSFVMITAICMCIIGFLGIISGLSLKKNLVVIYIVCMILLLFMQALGLLILGATTNYPKQAISLASYIKTKYGNDSKGKWEKFTNYLNKGQKTYNCCGIMSKTDYLYSSYHNETGKDFFFNFFF